jgi:hypothetical protein
LKEDLDAGDNETKVKLDALRVALWNGGAIETTLTVVALVVIKVLVIVILQVTMVLVVFIQQYH